MMESFDAGGDWIRELFYGVSHNQKSNESTIKQKRGRNIMTKIMITVYNHAKNLKRRNYDPVVIDYSFTYDLLRLWSKFSCFQFCLPLGHAIAL